MTVEEFYKRIDEHLQAQGVGGFEKTKQFLMHHPNRCHARKYLNDMNSHLHWVRKRGTVAVASYVAWFALLFSVYESRAGRLVRRLGGGRYEV